MTEQPLKLSDGWIAKMKALRGKVPADPRQFMEMLRYARSVVFNRHWLKNALEHKDEVISLLNQQREQEALSAFREEFNRFVELGGAAPRLKARTDDIKPKLSDRASVTPIDRHYTYHPAWAARVLARTRPKKHIDISSIVSFCAVVSAFIPVEFYDFRPAPVQLDGLYVGAADLTQLHFPSDSIASLSCIVEE